MDKGDHRQRAIDLCAELGIDRLVFKEKTGLNDSRFSAWLTKAGRSSPSLDQFSHMCNTLDLNPTYLMFGVLPKRLSEAETLSMSENEWRLFSREIAKENNDLLKEMAIMSRAGGFSKLVGELKDMIQRILDFFKIK